MQGRYWHWAGIGTGPVLALGRYWHWAQPTQPQLGLLHHQHRHRRRRPLNPHVADQGVPPVQRLLHMAQRDVLGDAHVEAKTGERTGDRALGGNDGRATRQPAPGGHRLVCGIERVVRHQVHHHQLSTRLQRTEDGVQYRAGRLRGQRLQRQGMME
jgi:hypothetical protein